MSEKERLGLGFIFFGLAILLARPSTADAAWLGTVTGILIGIGLCIFLFGGRSGDDVL